MLGYEAVRSYKPGLLGSVEEEDSIMLQDDRVVVHHDSDDLHHDGTVDSVITATRTLNGTIKMAIDQQSGVSCGTISRRQSDNNVLDINILHITKDSQRIQ